MGSGRPCFSATCTTARPRDNLKITSKSAFAEFGNTAIFGKWYWWYWNDVRAAKKSGLERQALQQIIKRSISTRNRTGDKLEIRISDPGLLFYEFGVKVPFRYLCTILEISV